MEETKEILVAAADSFSRFLTSILLSGGGGWGSPRGADIHNFTSTTGRGGKKKTHIMILLYAASVNIRVRGRTNETLVGEKHILTYTFCFIYFLQIML